LGSWEVLLLRTFYHEAYNVHVYNRTKEKAQLLVEKGAVFHSTPQELASVAEIIMTWLMKLPLTV